MTPRQLQAFVAVAQSLSFARASERLHISQPALSLSIRELERSLGGALLVRTTRQVRLTTEGTALLPHALQLLADWDNLRDRARRRFTLEQGHIAIAAMPSFAGSILPQVLRAFRQRFSNIGVSVHDVINEQVIEMVESGRAELGYCFEPDGESTLSFEPLFEDRFVAIVPPGVALGGKSVTWRQLLKNDFISLQRPSSLRRLLEESLALENLELHLAFECHQLATIVQMVSAGLGVSVVPSLLTKSLTAMGVRCAAVRQPIVHKRVGAVTRPKRQLSAAAAALHSAMRDAHGPAHS